MTRLPSTNHANPHPFPSFFDLRSQIVSKLTSCDRRSENVEETGGEVGVAWTTLKTPENWPPGGKARLG